VKKPLSDFYNLLRVLTYLQVISGLPLSSAITKIYHNLSKKTDRCLVKKVPRREFCGIEVTPFKYGAAGAFCVSIDLELSWGKRFTKGSCFAPVFSSISRRNFQYVLAALEKYSIPATWAIVGHLFLVNCEKDPVTKFAHPEMPRPSFHKNRHWEYTKGDWYQHDPCNSLHNAPEWYAADLVSKILCSSIRHEVGTHSFSHIDFSNCDKDLAYAELLKCKEIMRSYNLTPRSLVFPGNLEGQFEVLPKVGIIAFRGPNQDSKLQYPDRLENGLWAIPGSMQLTGRGIEKKLVSKAIRLIDSAIENNAVFHLWFHVHEVDKRMVEKALLPIFDYAKRARNRGVLWIATMEEIANYCEAAANVTGNVVIYDNELRIELKSIEHINRSRFTNPEVSLKVGKRFLKVMINGKPIEAFELHSKDDSFVVTLPLKD